MFGPIALFGSGETAPGAHRIHGQVMGHLKPPVVTAILETPAGFEPNSAAVAGKIGAYLTRHLRNFSPQVTIVPARKRGTDFDPDDPSLAAPLFDAQYLFMGPGSPSYAVRQLQDSYVWHALQARHRLGAAICFSSATTLAAGRFTLPVYEIYKVGQDLHWIDGLDFFAPFGVSLAIVPHWNNNDGGKDLDTSRCYMGQNRFHALLDLLPTDVTVVGIDENTGVVIDPMAATCQLIGQGQVTILTRDWERRFEGGDRFDVSELGTWRLPTPEEGIPANIWLRANESRAATLREPTANAVPSSVQKLAAQRQLAREARDWQKADALREQITALGWQVLDTPDGPQLERAE